MDANYWEHEVDNAATPEEFRAAMDGMMSNMVDEGHISMSWDDELEEIVFFMTPEQKSRHDLTHPG